MGNLSYSSLSRGGWADSLYANLYCFHLETGTPQLGKINLVPWKVRNELVFKGKEYAALEVLQRAVEDYEEWSARRVIKGRNSCPRHTNG